MQLTDADETIVLLNENPLATPSVLSTTSNTSFTIHPASSSQSILQMSSPTIDIITSPIKAGRKAASDTLPDGTPVLKSTKRKYTKLQLKEKTLTPYQRHCLNFPVASITHYRNYNGTLTKKCAMSRNGGRAMAMLFSAFVQDFVTKSKDAMIERGGKRVSIEDVNTVNARYGPTSVDL